MITRTQTSSRLQRAPAPSHGNKLRRALWIIVQATIFRWSPVPLHAWRRVLLRLFGARIASDVHPYPDATIWAPWNLEMARGSCLGPRVICYNVGTVSLGVGALVSQGAHLCAASHDFRDPDFPLIIGPIRIESFAWVCADGFVGPGVVIGEKAVVGARSLVVKDVEANLVVAGNPAQPIGRREQ